MECSKCFVLYTCDSVFNVFTSNNISGVNREIIRSSEIICENVAENIWGKLAVIVIVIYYLTLCIIYNIFLYTIDGDRMKTAFEQLARNQFAGSDWHHAIGYV
jgi:hypothetical protein